MCSAPLLTTRPGAAAANTTAAYITVCGIKSGSDNAGIISDGDGGREITEAERGPERRCKRQKQKAKTKNDSKSREE